MEEVMGKKKCNYADHLVKIIRKGDLDKKTSDHIRHCPECREIFNIHGILMKMSAHDRLHENNTPPPFESLWEKASRKVEITPEQIGKAMMPIRITGMVSRMIFLITAVVLLILTGPAVLGNLEKSGIIRIFNAGFINPFIRIFKSSYFVSIPENCYSL